MDEIRRDVAEEIHFIRSKVKIPQEKFIGSADKPGFYNKFAKVGDLVNSQEWQDVYSQFYEFDRFEMDIEIQGQEDPEQYTSDRQLQEFIKCANSFPYFCHKYIKIFHPIDGLIPCILYKYQRKVIRQYEDHRFCVISKFRQGGLTTIAVLWSVWRCMFKTDQEIMVLSKTDREAMAAGEVAKRALENLPRWLRPQMDGESKHEKVFKETGCALKFYTPEAARGKSLTILIIDEAAFIPDMETHWKAMYPVIATGGACYVISTVNGLGNWYEEQYHGAQADPPRNRFHVIDLDYWEHPDYCRPEWIQETKTNLGDKAWAQEVLRNFLGSGDTFIPAHIINELIEETRERMPKRILLEQWVNRGEKNYGWDTGSLWVWVEPHESHEYIIGVDCAEGVRDGGDNSCFQVLDMKTLEQVAEFYSNSITPNSFAMVLERIGIMYNHALIVVETNGVGSAVANALHSGLGYDNLHFENKGKDPKPGVRMAVSNRSLVLEALQNKMLNGTLVINSARFVDELKTFVFVSKAKKAQALKNKHDDAIIAMSIAICVRDQLIHDVPVGVEIPEETTQIFKSDIYEQIKQEILRGVEEDVLSEEEEERNGFFNFFNTEKDDDDSEAIMFRRRNSALLSEFGW
jgi:sRNA-binding carbon storage regulator CsrA